jgi:hypothetical protein
MESLFRFFALCTRHYLRIEERQEHLEKKYRGTKLKRAELAIQYALSGMGFTVIKTEHYAELLDRTLGIEDDGMHSNGDDAEPYENIGERIEYLRAQALIASLDGDYAKAFDIREQIRELERGGDKNEHDREAVESSDPG